MQKEFEMALIIVVCAVLGIVTAVITNMLYTNGILIDEIVVGSSTITIDDLMFLIFLAWIIIGIIIGVLKN